MKMSKELFAIVECYELLATQDTPDARLTNLVGLALRRAARIMTDKQVDHKAARDAKFNSDLKTVYDNDGKLRAIRDYRIYYGCGLLEAKRAVEELFPYTSPYYNHDRYKYSEDNRLV